MHTPSGQSLCQGPRGKAQGTEIPESGEEVNLHSPRCPNSEGEEVGRRKDPLGSVSLAQSLRAGALEAWLPLPASPSCASRRHLPEQLQRWEAGKKVKAAHRLSFYFSTVRPSSDCPFVTPSVAG